MSSIVFEECLDPRGYLGTTIFKCVQHTESSWVSRTLSQDELVAHICEQRVAVTVVPLKAHPKEELRCDGCGHAAHKHGRCPDETHNGYSCRCRR